MDLRSYIQQKKKKIKFEDIHQALSEQFPTKSFSVVSDAIKAAFSKTYSKLVGISRTKHISGLEANLSVALTENQPAALTCLTCYSVSKRRKGNLKSEYDY